MLSKKPVKLIENRRLNAEQTRVKTGCTERETGNDNGRSKQEDMKEVAEGWTSGWHSDAQAPEDKL